MRRRQCRVRFGAVALGAMLCSSTRADADSAAAEVLFREGRRLLVSGHAEEACAKFAESERLDPSSGTLINLARCNADLGKLATAWATYLEAQRLALAQHRPDRAREAKSQANALEPKLSRVLIRMIEPIAGITIERNGETLTGSVLDTSLPVDPGTYTFRFSAPGHVAWTHSVDVQAPGEQTIEVPPLAPEPEHDTAAARDSAESPRSTDRAEPRVTSMTTAPRSRPSLAPGEKTERAREQLHRPLRPGFWGAAATSLAFGTAASVFGVLSLRDYHSARDACPTRENCGPGAIDDRDRARTQAKVADVGFVVAALATALAGYLYFDAPSEPPRTKWNPAFRKASPGAGQR